MINHPVQTLELHGLKCPLPVLKTGKALKSLTVGERIKVVATDPASFIDFPHFCTEQGHLLVSTDEVEGVFTYVIEKGQ